MNFWVLIGVMTLIIGAVAFFPLLKQVKTADNKRDKLNKAFYFDRLKEVERETAEGIIDDPEQTKWELQQSLLDDIPADEQPLTHQKRVHKGWFVALMLLVGGVSTAVYWNVGAWFAGTMLEMSHKKLDYFYERLKDENTDPLSEQEMNQFAMALRVELERKPHDAEGWFMLGQLGMTTENLQMAMESYAKAAQLQPENLWYKQKHAEMLMFSADPKDKEKGETLIKEIIRIDHTNLGALRLLAFHLFEKEEYQMAAMTWAMMLRLMPEDDPSRAVVERSMQTARAMAEKGALGSPQHATDAKQ